jgi:hypothetical protein
LFLSGGGFFSAAFVEKLANLAADDCGNRSGDAGVLQRQQPDRKTRRGHGDDHDVEASTQFVHRFYDVHIVIAKAELDLNHRSDADKALVAEIDSKGQRLGNVVSPERRREGQKCHEAEQNESSDERSRLDLIEKIEEPMLKDPEACREDESDDESDPVAEGLCKSVDELAVRHIDRHLDFKDQQGHDDGENRIAESFEPVLAVHGVTIVFDCGRKRKRRVL